MALYLNINDQFNRLLSVRSSNGSDFWATPDEKLGIERPISTLTALMIMSELRVLKDNEALQDAAELVMSAVKSDGRVTISPKGSVYPCHTALSAAALCRNSFCKDERTKLILRYLATDRHTDGGWRCKKFLYGKGPETELSNPGVTLIALDAFRCARLERELLEFDDAVETLLDHWVIRSPVGPCHFGIGKQFMQLEFPLYRYNIFYFVYVLSFFKKAVRDERFKEALDVLRSKLDQEGNIIIEKTKPQLQKLGIYKAGALCNEANERFKEIIDNIERLR